MQNNQGTYTVKITMLIIYAQCVILDDKERYKEENSLPVNHAVLEIISYVLPFYQCF